METPDFKSKWPDWKEKIQSMYPDFSDEDLMYELDKEEELLERLQMKTGKTKAQIYEWLHMMG